MNSAQKSMTMALFAVTIFSSAFLLFLVQPLISKHILPWFGGSAAVWATCMVFFQVVLLAGYAYSDWITRHLKPLYQVTLHVALLAVSLVFLPIIPDPSWKPTGSEDPALLILVLLVSTIGLPYFLISTTGPLIQAWVTRTLIGTHVYRFFALSNLASLLALVSYPFLIEPRTSLHLQAYAWSDVYALFALLCTASAFYFFRHARVLPAEASAPDHKPESGWKPHARDYLSWLGLSAIGSWLLVAITNHITQNIAAIPFLWLLPLTIYLLTFVLCFESDRWYVRSRFLIPTAVFLATCAYGLGSMIGYDVKVAIPLYSVGLFFFCMFCHGELAQMRPAPQYLTRFYLMASFGGALGGIMVGLVAPRILPAYYELGIGFIIIALSALFLLHERKLLTAGAACLALLCGYFLFAQVSDDFKDTRKMERSFYGTLLTFDKVSENPADNIRELRHGAVKHGGQYLTPNRRLEPTTYYGPTAGIGLAIAHTRSPGKKVGVIGLGAGTLAAYGQPGDVYRFYEINPQVIELARSEFTFISDSKARIEIVQGDARLSLEKEKPQGFDVLAVDAFSGDSVPIHLITREAVAIYLRHMNPDGIIAFHVTNTFLSLAPVVQKLAADHGLYSVLIHDEAKNSSLPETDWVLIAKDKRALQPEPIREAASSIKPIFGLATWTDDFNNLFDVLK
jgi:hypothetical protein